MGVVYQAWQQSLKRPVALKMLREGMLGDPETRDRFRREAEAVAGLRHPHIVQIYEIGEQDSQPYFSLEYVEGGSLAQKVHGTPQPPTEAAKLVETVARAIDHAHQQGIVHRDLKPSNILLVGEPETPAGQCTPKITDFGLAKQVNVAPADAGPQTETGVIVGTAEYMAPEQASGRTKAISSATDVYALGVVLYELLTGRPPFKATSRVDTLWQVLHDEPVPPRRLQPRVPRDLDTICLKCLHKEARKRYATALDLAEDLRCFREGKAIRARPMGPIARAWRWSRRNRVVAGLLALVVTLLIGGTVVSYCFALQALRAEKQAEADRDNALAAARASRESEAVMEAFSNFLVDDVLAVARPEGQDGGLGIDVTVRQMLDVAAAKAGPTFAGRPRAEAKTRFALGKTYWYVGKLEEAAQQLEQAVVLYRTCLGSDHPDTLASMHNLAQAYQDAGQQTEALKLFEETRQLTEAKLGPDHQDTMFCTNSLARAYQAAGRVTEALPLFEQTLQWAKAKLGPDHRDTVVFMRNLASAYHATGQLAKAGPLWEEAIELMKTQLGPDHPETLTGMNGLARVYEAVGRRVEALRLFQETLERRQAKLGPDHPDTLSSMNNLACAYFGAGQLTEAIPVFQEALKRRRAKFRPDHPDILSNMNNLACAYFGTGQYTEAISLFEETLKLMQAKLGPCHPETLRCRNNLASAYQAARQLSKALALKEETLKLMQAELGPDHPDTLTSMNNLARGYEAAGRLAEALRLFKETLQLRQAKLGSDHPEVARTLASVGLCLLKEKKFVEAESLLRESCAIYERKLPDAWERFLALSLLGGSLLGQQKYAEAEPLVLRGYEGMRQREAKMPADAKKYLTETLDRLVQLYDAWGQKDKADEWRKKGSERQTKKPSR
jgi:tetratricopeptide (TPR) repeat protein